MWRGSYEGQVAALGAGLFEAGRGRVTWVELDRVAARVGLDSWFDEGGYYSARLPFRLKHLPDYMHAFRAAWRSANARVKKVLVLDLDNTLWGGVIGDAGVDGIVIGPGSATGEAFQNWGLYLKRLRARGVTLAVCSRNDPELAAAAFDHAGMVLKRTDFAAFDCSWGDKAAGLKRIAGQVGVGVDSLVFADDNPAECEQVRGALPDVGVVHLGADPARFIALLDRGQWFDLSQYTAEDMSRSSAYAARASAKAEAEAASDISTFLGGLRMVGKIATAGRAELGRLAQLEQKTNQFNLTTRRYTEADLTVFIDRPDAVVLALWLADKFGDHGLVSSLIGMIEGDALRIDSWLMSCRVFSRTAEQFAMRRLIEAARTRGASRVVGEYIPTKKNAVVSDLFERLGFARVDGREGLWTLDIRQAAGPAATETWIADHDDDSERAAAE
jgi:FkbH-like protein